jgi:hypothetical protein
LSYLLEASESILTLMVSDIELFRIVEERQNRLVIFRINECIFGIFFVCEVDESELSGNLRLSHFSRNHRESEVAAGDWTVLGESCLQLVFR